MRFSVTSRRLGGVGQPPRQAAGHYGECLNWANALEQPPARLRGGLREGPQISAWSLAPRKGALWGSHPHGKTHSGCVPSRRSTLCTLDLTERRILRAGPHGKVQCAWLPAHRVRFSVGRRRVCPGEEKRTLRKTALCASDLTERRTLGESPSRKGAFWLRALGGGAFPPVVFEHVTESSTTVRAEWDDRLPAQVHRSQKSCGKEVGLNLKAKDPPEANAPIGSPCLSRRAWT